MQTTTTMTVTKLCALLDSCIAELGNLKRQIGVNEEFLKLADIADKRAREEIIDIMENTPIGSHGTDDALTRAIRIIRDTIPEEQ